MIISVRCDDTGNGDVVDNVFFDVVEVDQGTDAESLCSALRNSLQAAGLRVGWVKSFFEKHFLDRDRLDS